MPNPPGDEAAGCGQHSAECWQQALHDAETVIGWWVPKEQKISAALRRLDTGQHECLCAGRPLIP